MSALRAYRPSQVVASTMARACVFFALPAPAKPSRPLPSAH